MLIIVGLLKVPFSPKGSLWEKGDDKTRLVFYLGDVALGDNVIIKFMVLPKLSEHPSMSLRQPAEELFPSKGDF